jgi:lipopolysaccharide transport system ATP-binding protein
MPKPIIEIQNIGKRYRIGANKEPYLSLRDEISKFFSKRRMKGNRDSDQDFWALKDVSFTVQEGEAVGIIGRNGAGKSTLLKILSQITPPTEGKITMRGRVASLLEVGTGFHPELTGRENIYLNGAILGMTRSEIRAKFDEIVAFAEIDKFLDTPVKRYSSGMYVRLAFAVAAHMEPEILVVDEVLAVGDVEFQKKCLGKMDQVAKGGRTILFVSHNMQAIKMLCKKAILLQAGKCIMEAQTQDIVNNYLSESSAKQCGIRTWDDVRSCPGDEHLNLIAVRLKNELGNITDQFESSKPIIIELELDIKKPDPDLTVGFDLTRSDGVVIFRSLHNDEQTTTSISRGCRLFKAIIPCNLLNAGNYAVAPRISIFNQKWIVDYQFPSVVSFDLIFTHGKSSYMNHPDRWQNGIIAPVLEWSVL